MTRLAAALALIVALAGARGVASAQPDDQPQPQPGNGGGPDDQPGPDDGAPPDDDGGGDIAPCDLGSGLGPRMQGRPIEHIDFRGNRKVEKDAILVNMLTRPGAQLDLAKLREDVRAMWKMGFF